MWICLLAFCLNFLNVFMKGFQHKHVIGGHLKSAAATAFFMGVADVATVTTIVQGGLIVGVFVGLGASAGIVAAMLLHDRIYSKSGKLG